MSLRVVLTGTGVPVPDPERAGAGTLVQLDGVSLQIDVGRGTVMRLAGALAPPESLDAVLLTHHHSDHLVGLADLVLTRWIAGAHRTTIVAPAGPAARFAEQILDPWADDIAIRQQHANHGELPTVDVVEFDTPEVPQPVWHRTPTRPAPSTAGTPTDSDDTAADAGAANPTTASVAGRPTVSANRLADVGAGNTTAASTAGRPTVVTVTAVAVHHEPVLPAVAYRIDGPSGSVVVSGDTVVCAEVERLAAGADVLVHEVCLRAFAEAVVGTRWAPIASYHADAVELGAMAQRAGVGQLVLTHFIPPPLDGYGPFVAEVRNGGFTGHIVAGPDLTEVTL